MPRAQHIPRPEQRGRQSARLNQPLSLLPHGEIGPHDGRKAAPTDARMDARSTARNCTALAGLGFGVPTRCTRVSAGAIAAAKLSASSASPRMTSTPDGNPDSEPGRTSARTACPRWRSSGRCTRPR